MGMTCTPCYANLCLGTWEGEIFIIKPVSDINKVHKWMKLMDGSMIYQFYGKNYKRTGYFYKSSNNANNIKLPILKKKWNLWLRLLVLPLLSVDSGVL